MEGHEPVPAVGGASKKLRIAAAVAIRPAIFKAEHYEGFSRQNPSPRALLDLFDEDWHFNPVEVLSEDDHAMADLWAMRRASGGMAGGPLPDPGGLLQQSALMMDALRIMDAAAASIEEEDRQRERRQKQGAPGR